MVSTFIYLKDIIVMSKLGNISKLIEQQYAIDGNVIIPATEVSSLGNYQDILNAFHMTELYLVERNDDYFCGIRANHFCVEVGFSELNNDNEQQILISANHKGIRMVTMLSM